MDAGVLLVTEYFYTVVLLLFLVISLFLSERSEYFFHHCLFTPTKQSKTEQYLIYDAIKQRQAAHPYFWGAGIDINNNNNHLLITD